MSGNEHCPGLFVCHRGVMVGCNGAHIYLIQAECRPAVSYHEVGRSFSSKVLSDESETHIGAAGLKYSSSMGH